MKPRSVPTCWSAFLVLPVQLDHIDLLVSPQRKFDHVVEPSSRDLPSLELRTPFRFRRRPSRSHSYSLRQMECVPESGVVCCV